MAAAALSAQAGNLEAAANRASGGEGEMSDHMAAMWAGQSNVLVAVRVRPILKHDVIRKSCVRVLDSKVVVILDPATAGDKQDILRANRTREKQYAFDYAFEPGSSQEAAYHHTAKFLIHGVLDGFSATVFAYGQTGSGKTHTMIGTEENPGIMVRVMSDLFKYSVSAASKMGKGVYFKVTASFLEVYNENIRDLLGSSNSSDEYLDLREDPIKGPVVAGITEVDVYTSGEIMKLLHQGNAKRSQAATAANEVSSRSHAVLQVTVENRDRAPGVVDSIKVGKLSLIDLAGSERAANTQNRGARLVEGANINRSLLALGPCINALGEKGNKGNFVPYRDSKLTRLLKDSLGGNCRTVMIANISPAESSFEETLNTLKYANRAKNIKTQVKRNVLNVNYHISEYVELINNLRGEIKVLKNQIEVPSPHNSLESSTEPSLQENAEAGKGGGNFAAFGNDVNLNGNAMPAPVNINQAAKAADDVHNNPGNWALNAVPQYNQGPARNISTPLDSVRGNLRSSNNVRAGTAATGKDRELVNSMRQLIVNNFQERMQLRRSLIELEDQNVQNSIEISKRELIVVNWTETRGGAEEPVDAADLSAKILAEAPQDVGLCWREVEQIRKAILKNNGMKRSIAKRLRHNEREAERVRDELSNKITGEDRRELMELQYQVGRLELENMELEQHRIVHESILKGKDLVIQKLKLQLAVKDKLIQRQASVLRARNLEGEVGYSSLALFENALLGSADDAERGIQHILKAPSSPPRTMTSMDRENQNKMKQLSPRNGQNNEAQGRGGNQQNYMRPTQQQQKQQQQQQQQQQQEQRRDGHANDSANTAPNAFGDSQNSESSPYQNPTGTHSPRSPRRNDEPVSYKPHGNARNAARHNENDPNAANEHKSSHEGAAARGKESPGKYNSSQGEWVEVVQKDGSAAEGFRQSSKVHRTPPAKEPTSPTSSAAKIPISPVTMLTANKQQKGGASKTNPSSRSSMDDFDDFTRRMQIAQQASPGAGGSMLNNQSSERLNAGGIAGALNNIGANKKSPQTGANTHKSPNSALHALSSSGSVPMPQQASRTVPSVYDSPSVIPHSSNPDGPPTGSRYEQVYPMSFNSNGQGQAPQRSVLATQRSRGQHQNEVPNVDSPQRSPRLILGHELDEQSIETIVSEPSLEVARSQSVQEQQPYQSQGQAANPAQVPNKQVTRHYQPSQPSGPVRTGGQVQPGKNPRMRGSESDLNEGSSQVSHPRDKKTVLGRVNRNGWQSQQQAPQPAQSRYRSQENEQPPARVHNNPYLSKAINGPPRPGGAPSGNPRQQFQRQARAPVKASLDTRQSNGQPARSYQQRPAPLNEYGQPVRPIRGAYSNRDKENPPSNANIHGVPSLQPYLNNNQQDQMSGNSAANVNNLRKQLRNMSNKGANAHQTNSARESYNDPIMGYRADPQIHSAR